MKSEGFEFQRRLIMRRSVIFIMTIALLFSLGYISLAEGTRDFPYLMGERFLIDGESFVDGYRNFEFELLDAIRGQEAYEFILEQDGEYNANRMLEKGEAENKEIFLAKFFCKALELDKEPANINTASIFDVMDSTGSVYNRESASNTNNPFGQVREVYEGGEITGWVTFLIPEGDSPLLLVSAGDSPAFINPEVGENKKLVNLTLDMELYNQLMEKAEGKGLTLNEYLIGVLKE